MACFTFVHHVSSPYTGSTFHQFLLFTGTGVFRHPDPTESNIPRAPANLKAKTSRCLAQSYAALRTGSLWVPAFLHGVVNSVDSFPVTYTARPHYKVFSFGLGICGLICLALAVALILRDPLWGNRDAPGTLAATET